MTLSIDVIHGPNLNMLGRREPEIYGTTTLKDIDQSLVHRAAALGVEITTFQSNSEGALVDRIQHAFENCHGLIINPAAYTHTSVALRDALSMLSCPILEVHLSNIHKREAFRHHSHVSGVAQGIIAGFGARGYLMALDALVEMIREKRNR
ncbi:MAG: type II 3-dehydroquinate dehydratase [Desulfobacterales bacterium]|nr:type II 3-dehydroquinate dehydratase [Desulfobacterales bacterium]